MLTYVPSQATEQQQLTPACLVTVGGVPVDVEAWDTQHGVDQLIGTANLTIPMPLHPNVAYNASVEIQAGYTSSGLQRVFSGRIVGIDRSFDIRGATARIRCNDWMELLDYTDERDIVFRGPVLLAEMFRSFCRRRRMPMFSTDHVYYANGFTHVYFGGNPNVDGGDVIVRKRTSPLEFLSQKARLVGYRVYGAPNGQARLSRVSGKPVAGVSWGTEGVNVISMGTSGNLKDMVTFWEVTGASYTDNDGIPVKIISRPAAVPASPLLTPPGYDGDTLNDSSIVTQGRADAIRQILEIDHSVPREVVDWETTGHPELQPGDGVVLWSQTLEIDSSPRWVMSVRHGWSRQGFWTTFTAWAGAGTPLPNGSDSISLDVFPGVIHLGDEPVPWYHNPNPQGRDYTISFNVPDTYTAIVLSGLAHGVNSQFIDGAGTDDLKVSSFEFWQNGERVGSAVDLPVMPENYDLQLDYTNFDNWIPFRKAAPGQLEAGSAELRFIAGDNAGSDDFEVAMLKVTLTGVGTTELPRVR